MGYNTEFEHFDYVRITDGDHTGELAVYHGLDRENVSFWVHLVAQGGCTAIPFGGIEKISVEDFSVEEATLVAREWIRRTQDSTWCTDDLADEDLLDGEGGAGGVVCARDELDGLRSEPTVVDLLRHHGEVPAVATLLGELLARNERLRIGESRMDRLRTLRYHRIWGSEPVSERRDPRLWLVDRGGLCP